MDGSKINETPEDSGLTARPAGWAARSSLVPKARAAKGGTCATGSLTVTSWPGDQGQHPPG